MFTLTISTFVTIADLFLKAFQPEMSETLGPYVPLIIVNCIIICRAEACASKSGLVVSIIDAVGMGIGFTLTLCVLAAVRELLATGAIFEIQILALAEKGGWFVQWAAMSMPVGAFITLGLLLGLVNVVSRRTRLAVLRPQNGYGYYFTPGLYICRLNQQPCFYEVSRHLSLPWRFGQD